MAASFLHFNREGHTPLSAIILASVKLTVLYPVVDCTFGDSERGCNIGNGNLSGSEWRRYLDLVDMAKPAYCRNVERLSGSSAEAGSVERCSNLLIATCAVLPYEFDRIQRSTAARRPTHQ